MIALSNKHVLEYVVASGALAFDAKGWPWEKPLIWLRLLRPELFTVFIKTLTLKPRPGNLRWFCPWRCVQTIPDGSVNKIGLTNPGFDYWKDKIAPRIDFKKQAVGGSIFGTEEELVEMANWLNYVDLRALEVNPSCPNTGHAMDSAEMVIRQIKAVALVSRHPIVVKVSVDQDYLAIAKGLAGIAQAISLNSVPWKTVFPNGQKSPLWRLEEKVGGGGGGVSGGPAQVHNWKAVRELAEQGQVPVIAPSIMRFEDIATVRELGASAVSFGAIHLPSHPVWLKPWTIFTNPCKPTRFVRREMRKGKLKSIHAVGI